ncbi:ornithine cyclodeaminase [Demequina sp. SO4-13]|uniref:ornithine cyclodeaminase n=1 Tax=Demequina sp. SO4-13 TaxID=3401027 RepID=UPI003AF602AE
MVQFVGVPQMRAWVSEVGPERIIAGLTEAVEQDLLHWRRFDKIPRVASHSPVGVIELMPTSDGSLYAFKYVNGHPSNPSRGLQTVTAFGMLADVATGYPLLVSEMTVLTALRTAATSAVAARALARKDSRVHALIGAGSQSEFQAIAIRVALGINTVRVFDTDPEAIAKFERNARSLGFDVYRASSAADAVEGADIVTTCTADKSNAHVLEASMIAPGTHINAIGGDCPGKTELDVDILHAAGVIAVEFEPQTRIEGEIQQLEANHPVTALWDVLAGAAAGRTADADITVFDSVGFAMEDFSALRFLRDSVSGTHWVEEIDIVAEPQDPKDLFSLAMAPILTR